MLHELTEAREKLVFLVENLQERGAEIRHSLAVSNLGICQCISSKDPLQLCNASRSVLRSQGKALRLSCESIRVRAYSTNCCLPILKSSLDLWWRSRRGNVLGVNIWKIQAIQIMPHTFFKYCSSTWFSFCIVAWSCMYSSWEAICLQAASSSPQHPSNTGQASRRESESFKPEKHTIFMRSSCRLGFDRDLAACCQSSAVRGALSGATRSGICSLFPLRYCLSRIAEIMKQILIHFRWGLNMHGVQFNESSFLEN